MLCVRFGMCTCFVCALNLRVSSAYVCAFCTCFICERAYYLCALCTCTCVTAVPIAAPSANRFGHVSPTSARHVMDDLGTYAHVMVLNGGASPT